MFCHSCYSFEKCSVIAAICSFLVHFLLLLAIETSDVNDNMIFKCVKLVEIVLSIVLMWVCLPRPAIKPFVHFFSTFPLIAGYYDFECKLL